jgi:mycothiol synthase
VWALVAEAAGVDGVPPLSDEVRLRVAAGRGHLLLARESGELVGVAHLDADPDSDGGMSAELVVRPAARGRGVGDRMLAALLERAGSGGLRLWAHGRHPAAARLAARHGLVPVRSLWQMRLPLTDAPPAVEPPPGVHIRTFTPGRDETAWLEVNNTAFATHPEQGGWSVEDLLAREREPWFDPGGFFLAERDGRLVGFHWTKVHPAAAGKDALGEVYVVGVLPAEGGHGLGRALTVTGLRHLRDRGLAAAILYVDESNTVAVGVYERLGFVRTDTDVCYARPPGAG